MCFAGGSLVETQHKGAIDISLLEKGDYLKSYDPQANKWIYSRFIAYLHQDSHIMAEYVSIRTSLNKTLLISPLHLMATQTSGGGGGGGDQIQFLFAKDLRINDMLVTEAGNARIVELTNVYERGAYAPLTESGTLLVDSVLASCYANTNWHAGAHLLFQPLIKISNYLNIEGTSSLLLKNNQLPDNALWYAKLIHSFVSYLPLTSNFIYF